MLIRHPLTLLTAAVPALDLTPQNSCLLLQDLHAPFADAKQGRLAQLARAKVLLREFDEYFDALDLVAVNFGRVLSRARALGLPVVYSCLGYFAPAGPSAFQTATGWLWELGSSDGAFPAAWAPAPGEPIFAKPGWGVCGNPTFVDYLQRQGIQNVIVMGSMLEFGVRQSCAELADRGVQTLVVSDGVVGLTTVGRTYSGGSMAHGMTKLRSTGELLDLLTVLAQNGHVLI